MFIQNTSILWENRRTCPSIDNLLSQLLYHVTSFLFLLGTTPSLYRVSFVSSQELGLYQG